MLFAANAICAAIKEGCELYKQVKTTVVEVVDTANEVKEIATEVHGFVGAIVNWFKPKPVVAAVKPKKAKTKFKEVSEHDIIDDIAKNLVQFFKIQEQLIAILHEDELRTQTVYDPNQNLMESALNRVLMLERLAQIEEAIRYAMTYQAPSELGALYSKVFDMKATIQAEQELARQKLEAEARYKRWQQNQQKGKWRMRLAVLLVTLFLIGYLHLWLQIIHRQTKMMPLT